MARHLQSTKASTVFKPLRRVTEVTRGGFMKNQMFALIGLGLLLATASAYAQTGVVKANVPFNFIVAKIQIPAGEYTIHRVATAGSAMTIESSDRKLIQVVLPNEIGRASCR